MKSTILMLAIATGLSLPALQAAAEDGPRERPDFATLDVDGDGALTLAELEGQGQARFAQADSDGDGLLSQAELVAAAQDRHAERVEKMLTRLDTNEDGSLSMDEMPQRGNRMARMFDRADANDDGAITAEEFENARPEGGRGHGRGHGKHGGGSRHDGPRDDG